MVVSPDPSRGCRSQHADANVYCGLDDQSIACEATLFTCQQIEVYMHVIGWVIRTGNLGATRYWAVGEPLCERAAEVAGSIAGSSVVAPIGKISNSTTALDFNVAPGETRELWKNNLSSLLEGHITFDTSVTEEGQDHIEGCYRIGSGDWKVYYFSHWRDGRLWTKNAVIHNAVSFQSGIIGIEGVIPMTTSLNKEECVRLISRATNIHKWTETAGPNSLLLK